MRKSTFKTINIIGLGLILSMSACSDDDDSGNMITPGDNGNTPAFLQSEVDKLGNVTLDNFTVPTVYDVDNGVFAPGAYNGQRTRVAQLRDIVSVLRDDTISLNLRNALENNGITWTSTDATLTGANIRTKIDELNFDGDGGRPVDQSVADAFGDLADSLQISSQNFATTATNGTAGKLNNRHFSANGLEYAQILEKGLYGPLFYNQMVDDYLRPSQAGAQNPGGNNSGSNPSYATEGTERQHAFDEVFGYFGADPLTYPNTSNTSNGDGVFIANYTFDASDEIEAAMGINVAQKLMDAFIFGRSVLKVGEGTTAANEATNESYYNAARADIRTYLEIGIASASYHYLNLSIEDFNNAQDDDKLHHLSEALGFIYALQFNSDGIISNTDVVRVLRALGWGNDPSLNGIYDINLWNVNAMQLQQAKDILDESYPGFGALPL